MEENVKQLQDELVAKVLNEAIAMDSNVSIEDQKTLLMAANELLKTKNDMDLKDREMAIREKEVKIKKGDEINKAAATGVTAAGLVTFIVCWKQMLKLEGLGAMITSSCGKTLTSGLKIFKLFK